MVRNALQWTLAFGLLLGLVLFAACGGSDDDDGDDTNGDAVETATAQPDSGDEDGTEDDEDGGDADAGSGAEGSAIVTADGVETTLGVDDCIPPEDNSPIVVTATNADENASLSLGGIAGAVTAEFNRDGEQWIAVGAFLDVDGSTFSYNGPALKTDADPPDSQLAFEVTCS